MSEAFLYKTKIFQTELHFSHDMGEMILEMWMPEEKMCLNELGYVFHSDEPRCKDDDIVKKIKIEPDFLKILKDKINIDALAENNIKQAFKILEESKLL